jgi:multidrug efflux pump subunit AcrB
LRGNDNAGDSAKSHHVGFVAILGVVALIGVLIRNSVILVVQIETLRGEGLNA